MEHAFRGALSWAKTRVLGSRFAKPIARVALAAAALALLAFVGRTAIAGAGAAALSAAVGSGTITPVPPSGGEPRPLALGDAPSVLDPHAGATEKASPAAGPALPSPAVSLAARASPGDPVVLNAATETDLRRLPGIGAKRADAILALRIHLGRFRAVEDLLKVKGIGRATLKRLRPLIRVDAAPPDAGPPSATSAAR
jgi:competence protein ComEA